MNNTYRYVHAVNYHQNGVDQEAHKGAVRGLAADANCIYTYGACACPCIRWFW